MGGSVSTKADTTSSEPCDPLDIDDVIDDVIKYPNINYGGTKCEEWLNNLEDKPKDKPKDRPTAEQIEYLKNKRYKNTLVAIRNAIRAKNNVPELTDDVIDRKLDNIFVTRYKDSKLHSILEWFRIMEDDDKTTFKTPDDSKTTFKTPDYSKTTFKAILYIIENAYNDKNDLYDWKGQNLFKGITSTVCFLSVLYGLFCVSMADISLINNNPYITYHNNSDAMRLKVTINGITLEKGRPAAAILEDKPATAILKGKTGGHEGAGYAIMIVVILLLLIYLMHENPVLLYITIIALIFGFLY